MTRGLPASCAIALFSSYAAHAVGQDVSADERARILFEQANEAADQERFAEARRLFEESLAVLPRTATAFNLAQVLRSVGALREAERRLLAIQSGTYGELPGHLVDAVRDLLAQVQAEIATLEVTVDGVDEVSVRVDAEDPLTVRAGRAERFRIDPGEHLVIARAPDGRTMDRAVRAATGERLAIAFAFRLATALSPPPVVPPDEGASLAWLGWTAGAVVVAAAVVVVIVLVSADPTREALTDPVWGQASALRIGGR